MTSVFGREYGTENVDFGRELVRQGIASWTKFAGITYHQWGDDNRPIDEVVGFAGNPAAGVGEIRVGGTAGSTPGSSGFPAAFSDFWGGGDMVLGLANFTSDSGVTPLFSQGETPECDWRGFRNTVTHEQGHGLGFRHPSEEGKYPPGVNPYRVSVMEAGNLGVPRVAQAVMTLPDGATLFDIRGAMHNYGDRFAGNHSLGTAKDLGNLTAEGVIFEPLLSTNGPLTASFGHADWFRFELTSPQQVSVALTPRGVEYYDFVDEECADAATAGQLSFEFYDAKGDLYIVTPGDPGDPKSIGDVFPAGVYYLSVYDTGLLATAATNRVVQMYDLELRVSPSATRRPFAFAGINKRVEVGERCHFIGDIHSFATEPAATIVQYDWDLDGNGSFETLNTARPFITYSSTGARTIGLRVVDSNGRSDTHSIVVDVVAARTQLFGVDVSEIHVGQEVAMSILGADLASVTGVEVVEWDSDLAAFVPAVGVVVDDSAMLVSVDGRTITGVLVEVTICATVDRPYAIKAHTAWGPVYLTTAFLATPIPGDLNGDFHVGFADLSIMLNGLNDPCDTLTPGCPEDDPNCNKSGRGSCQDVVFSTSCGVPAALTCCYPDDGTPPPSPCCPLDLNADCVVDQADVDIIILNYGLAPVTPGVTCP
jgi:hypothetical protein